MLSGTVRTFLAFTWVYRMSKAISYVRYSSKEQAKGDSYRRQVKAAEEYCKVHGLELDDTILDSGVSAFKGRNAAVGALASLIKDVDEGRIPKGTTLIIESLDRLSRMEVEKALRMLLQLIDEQGLIVVTLSDNNVYKAGSMDMITLMTSLLVMQRAHEESAMKSLRLGAAWSNKKEKARMGIVATARLPSWLKLVDGKCVVIEEKADVVREAFQLLDSGHGVVATIRRLNMAGVPAPSGKPWAPTSLKRLIDTQSVLGNYQPHTGHASNRTPVGDIIKGYYPQIIDEDLYWRVRHKHKVNNGNNGVRKDSVKNLFSGLVTCGQCGGPIRYMSKGAKHSVYFACRNRVEARGCDLPLMQYPQVERVVIGWLYFEGVRLLTPKQQAVDVDSLSGRLDENLKEQGRLAEAIAKLGFSEALEKHLSRLTTEAHELRARLQERPISVDSKDEFDELIASLKSDDGRRALVQQMKRLGLSLKIGVDQLAVSDKVTFKRDYFKGVWRWQGSNGQTLLFRMQGYENRLKGLKPFWGKDPKQEKHIWDDLLSYPSKLRLVEELYDEDHVVYDDGDKEFFFGVS
jgi:DNA invertase Pin-like site-specific DNA recombinase